MKAGTKVIHSDRLILRAFSLEDADSRYKNWISDKEVQFNYGEPEYEDIVSIQRLLPKWIP